MKAIRIKMVELFAMCAEEAQNKGYRVNNKKGNDEGYEIVYTGGYKFWCPKEIVDATYFILNEKNDGSKILKEDVEKFITDVDVMTVGDKTTVVNAHTLTGFDTVRHSSCVDPKNYDEKLGAEYAMEKVVDDLWGHLGFVLQWAKNGLKGDK